ncbi:hypothetical protein [uncultured Cellulomonas sp.]|uniref:hypothetical protein n=1 Tax=uncultured Cellulomonas sp. TaxID=189682 RepID=UPI0028EA54B7|nr:hypothetical protein [uncultured Cellulomonas sp.]
MHEEDIDGVAALTRAGAAGFVALSALYDPALGVIAAAALPAVDSAIDRVRTFKRAVCGYTIQVGADAAGVTPDDLVAQLVETPTRLLLLGSAMEAAAESAWQHKFRVLGRGLATGAVLDDDARVMEEVAWVRIMRSIEAPHLRILQYLSRQDPEHPGHIIAANRSELQTRSGFRELIMPTLAALERDSLIKPTDGSEFDSHFRARWGLTAGRDRSAYVRGELLLPCLARFRAAGAEDT